jgi:hypothetical protein
MVVRVAAVVLAVAAPADALRRGFHRAMSGTTMLAVWFSPDRNTSIVARLTPSFFPPRAVRDQASPATGERHAHGRRSAGATVQLRPRQPRCTNTTVDLDVTWTGEGPISRDAQTSPRQGDVIIEDAHFVGQSRAATATGELDGRRLGAANFALFGTARSGEVFVCHGPDIILCEGKPARCRRDAQRRPADARYTDRVPPARTPRTPQ